MANNEKLFGRALVNFLNEKLGEMTSEQANSIQAAVEVLENHFGINEASESTADGVDLFETFVESIRTENQEQNAASLPAAAAGALTVSADGLINFANAANNPAVRDTITQVLTSPSLEIFFPAVFNGATSIDDFLSDPQNIMLILPIILDPTVQQLFNQLAPLIPILSSFTHRLLTIINSIVLNHPELIGRYFASIIADLNNNALPEP